MKIGERGQVTIPKQLRDRYGLEPNIEVDIVAEESGIIIRKKREHSTPVQRVYGVLKKNSRTDDLISAMRGE